MKKKIVSIVLAIAVCICNLGNVSYAQSVEKNEMPIRSSVESEWNLLNVKFDKESPQQLSEIINISADIENAQEGFQYKFVWMKDSWKEWGILQDFSEKNSVEWNPQISGNYYIYVDVMDEKGTVKTVRQAYSIIKNRWTYEGINQKEYTQKLGEPITFTPETIGNTKGLQYKFVWMRDNWKEWKILQDFSEKKEVVFTPDRLGEYKIYIDIKDQEGDMITKKATYNVVTNIWNYDGVSTNLSSPQEQYCGPITISTKTSGEIDGLQYKFVWMQDDWKKWGIIRDFDEKNTVEWNPSNVGKYMIYADVKDADGKMVTKKIPFEITKANWNFDAIETGPQGIQKKHEKVTIKAITSGTTKGLQYKFVWMRDNWKEWGIIRDFTEKNIETWETPDKKGQYKIYVDIKDQDGEVRTKKIDYTLVTQLWDISEININNNKKEQVYTNIPIIATAIGETQNLQYKFTWKKGTESGIIRDFDTSNRTDAWYPKKSGKYLISVEIKDVDGVTKKLEKEYEVLPAAWNLEKLELDGSPDRFVGEKVKVTASTNGDTEGLQYRFVCQRGSDWSDWEVLQEFSDNASVEIPLLKANDYTIYVEIKDQRGVVFEPHTIKVRSHRYEAVGASVSQITKGQTVKIYPNVTGANGELQFKYVWMKDNWNEWGVLKDFSSTASIDWTPKVSGDYYIYIDVKANGVTQTKRKRIQVNVYQNPSQYLQIRHVQKTLSGGGYELSKGFMGLKVLYTQRKLGLNRTRAIMDDATMLAVRKFQSSRQLPVTGVVNLVTWKAMGFSEEEWYNLGTYTSKIKTNPNSTKQECIEAMISTAYEYLGTEYVIGAAGKPGTGADCSGLVMQSLYSAGIDPAPVDPIRHSHPGYEYESRNLWNLPMKKVPYSERQRGDLIFYESKNGVIIHVAIYLGNDQVIEEWPTKAVVWPIKNSHRSLIKGVMRPFV